jgi:HK97 family phage portal protein
MNPITSLKTWARKAFSWGANDAFTRTDGLSMGSINVSDVAGLRGYVEETNSVVAACLGWFVDTMPEAKLVVKKLTTEGEEVVPTHKVYELISKPNPSAGYLWRDILGAIAVSQKLDGNAYLRYRFNGMAQVVALEYIPASNCEPVEAAYGSGLSYYRVTVGGKVENVPINEIAHFRVGIDPRNTLKGFCAFKSVQRSILTDNEAEVYNHVILRNLGVLGWMISPNGDFAIDEKSAEHIKAQFVQQFTGEDRGKPFVASGPIKVEAVGHTPDKLQVTEIRKVPAQRICAVFRLSPLVVGVDMDRSTFSNMKEAREAAVESANCPMWTQIAEVLTGSLRELKVLKPDEFVDFDLSTVRALQEDEDAKHKRAQDNYRWGVWMRSESRAYTNKTSTPDDDIYFTDIQAANSQTKLMADAQAKSQERSLILRSLETTDDLPTE